jgi:hypothetical protein
VALWNALPGVENRRRVGDREALIDQLWSAIEALPDPGAIAPPHTGRRKGPDRRGLATNRRNRMRKIIACSELRYRTLDELEALFRTL